MKDKDKVKRFIKSQLDNIDKGDWYTFFGAFWDEIHLTHEDAENILYLLKSSDTEWDETTRLKVLLEGIRSVLDEEYQDGIELTCDQLYTFDAAWYTDGPTNWLGYSAYEFSNILQCNSYMLEIEFTTGDNFIVRGNR